MKKPKVAKIAVEGCPASFFLATPQPEEGAPAWRTAWAIAAGRGLRETDARAAALAEAAERMSVWSRGPDDPLLAAAPDAPVIPANAILHFSDRQRARFAAHPAAPAVEALLESPNRFLPMRRLSDGARLAVPALAGLFGEELRAGFPHQLSTSSGTAAHASATRARDGAVMELIERDAVALWWHHRLVPRRLAVAEARPDARIAGWLAARRRRTFFLDLPTDLPATVLAAVSCEPDGRLPSLGFAAATDPGMAATSAALEMVQGEISLRLMEGAQNLPDPPAVPPLLAFARKTAVDETPFLAGREADPLAGRRPRFEDRRPMPVAALLDDLSARGMAILIADITRKELGVPCVRAVSPHLRDWSARFAPGRLFEVPLALGLLGAVPDEDALNPEPFPI